MGLDPVTLPLLALYSKRWGTEFISLVRVEVRMDVRNFEDTSLCLTCSVTRVSLL